MGEYSKYISWKELLLNRIPSEQVLAKRKSQQILWNDELISASKFHKLQREFNFILENSHNDLKKTVFKGQVAFPGKVKGRVRKILKASEVASLKNGEVLVTYMTIPDFLPAMQKASAFITDEGGMTCHAAIVAREMKKTCIIGTKIATKILNNGDLVEVDAIRGIVRIL